MIQAHPSPGRSRMVGGAGTGVNDVNRNGMFESIDNKNHNQYHNNQFQNNNDAMSNTSKRSRRDSQKIWNGEIDFKNDESFNKGFSQRTKNYRGSYTNFARMMHTKSNSTSPNNVRGQLVESKDMKVNKNYGKSPT